MLGVALDGSRRIEPAHVGCLVGPDGSRRIVWMIKRMIKGHPTENRITRRCTQEAGQVRSSPTWAAPTRMPRVRFEGDGEGGGDGRALAGSGADLPVRRPSRPADASWQAEVVEPEGVSRVGVGEAGAVVAYPEAHSALDNLH